jgi:hypothetical protein
MEAEQKDSTSSSFEESPVGMIIDRIGEANKVVGLMDPYSRPSLYHMIMQ